MKKKTNKDIPESYFNKEVLKHKDYLYTFALLITGEESKAEKVLKNTYAKSFWFYPYLSPLSDIKTWLQRIMLKIFSDRIVIEEKPADENQNPVLKKIDRDLFKKKKSFEIRENLVKKISLLPPEMKNVLILKEVLEYTIEETGELVDIPDGTVLKRLFDARRCLYNILEEDEIKHSITSPDHIEYKDKKLIASLADSNDENEKFKDEIDGQRFIKSLIKEHLPVQKLRDAAALRIVKKFAPELKSEYKIKSGTANRKMIIGSTLAVIILFIIMIFVSSPDTVNPDEFTAEQKGENNAFLILKNNFNSYNKGNFNSSIITDSLEHYLSEYGIQNSSFISTFEGWQLYSLFFQDAAKVTLLNCIFGNEQGNQIYSLLFPLNQFDETKLTITKDLYDYLAEGNCYSTRENDIVFLMKRYGDNIQGFAVNLKNKDALMEICRQKPHTN